MRLPWATNRYREMEEEQIVLTPLHPTTILLPDHFSTPLQHLRYPVRLDFTHERFRLRSLALLSRLKDTALQDIDLSDNDLMSLTELNRFAALKSLCARRNSLESGPGVHLTVHRLTRLDVSGNLLGEVPYLKELPLLQVLNLSRNRISEGWDELGHCPGLQALDVSHNPLDWEPESDELQHAMGVLRGLKRLRVLNVSHTPASSRHGYRAWVLANARRLEVLDDGPVSEVDRQGGDEICCDRRIEDDRSSMTVETGHGLGRHGLYAETHTVCHAATAMRR